MQPFLGHCLISCNVINSLFITAGRAVLLRREPSLNAAAISSFLLISLQLMENYYYQYTRRILLIHVYLAANHINQIKISENNFFTLHFVLHITLGAEIGVNLNFSLSVTKINFNCK